MTGRVQGKVAFITGAARGQGRSHAIRLAEEGADIIAIDVCEDVAGVPYPGATEADLAQTVREVEALDRRIVAIKADVRDFAAVKAAVDEGVVHLGRLDIVAANAGISALNTPSHEQPEAAWNNMIDINLTGVWRTTKAAIPHLIAGGRGGAIILTSSIAGLKAFQGMGHYVAAKHGLIGLMRTLALELAPHMIRVNTVHPTQVGTDMIFNEALYKSFCPALEAPTRTDMAIVSQSMQALPVPWIDPVDVSNAMLFLASDEARYITGVTLPVDAGALLS